MKKVKLFTTLLMVVLCVGITSCSKDDDKSEASIVGIWNMSKCISGSVTPDTDRETANTSVNYSSTISLNSDGTCSWIEKEGDKTHIIVKGTYTYDTAKKILILKDSEGNISDTLSVIELTNTSLHYYKSDTEDNEYFEAYFNK